MRILESVAGSGADALGILAGEAMPGRSYVHESYPKNTMNEVILDSAIAISVDPILQHNLIANPKNIHLRSGLSRISI